MTAITDVWNARDPDSKGIWWSDDHQGFVMEATLISPLPFDLLEAHPENDYSYWNMIYSVIHHVDGSTRKLEKAYCKDIIIELGRRPEVTLGMIEAFPSLMHHVVADYYKSHIDPSYPRSVSDTPLHIEDFQSVPTNQFFFSPSVVALSIPAHEYDRIPHGSHMNSSVVGIRDENSNLTNHYNPFELRLVSSTVDPKLIRPRLERQTLGKILVIGNHLGGFGSCFMSHQQILAQVRNLLFEDVISQQKPLTLVDFQP